MFRSIHFSKVLLVAGLPLLILATLFLISKTSLINQESDALAIGITADILLTLPITYFLIIRKTNIPNITVVPILILGVLFGSMILPKEDQTYLDLFKTWGLPLIELGVVTFIFFKVRAIRKQFQHEQTSDHDFYTALVKACKAFFPQKLVFPIVTEISVFYYGFYKWRKRVLNINEFTYHKESGTVALLIVILFMVAVETFVIHLLLDRWSSLAAWILTLLSVYTGLQLFGFLKSIFYRPILIENGKIHLRYGIMSETTILMDQIEKIEQRTNDLEDDVIKSSLLGNLEGHNLVIHLKSKNEITRLYGSKKKYQKLALHVDEPDRFIKLINEI